MRFRPKIADGALVVASAWGVLFALEFLRPKMQANLMVAIYASVSLIVLIAPVVAYRTIYWETSSEHFLVRKLWRKKQIPWGEVTRVGLLGYFSGTFSISVGHQIEDYDRLYFEPSDRAGCIAEFRKFATQATFEID